MFFGYFSTFLCWTFRMPSITFRQSIVLALLAVTLHHLPVTVHGEAKIRFVKDEEYSYVALVRAYDEEEQKFTECGGVIIASYAVLTSCSCVADLSNKTIRLYDSYFSVVIAGLKNFVLFRDRRLQLRHLQKIELHPKCQMLSFKLVAFDLAIVTLEEPWYFNQYVSRASAPHIHGDDFLAFIHETISYENPCQAVGWGLDLVGEKMNQHVLKEVDVIIISRSDCVAIIEGIAKIEQYEKYETYIPDEWGSACALNMHDRRDIRYRLGGPIICRGTFVGFVTKQMDGKGAMPILMAAIGKSMNFITKYYSNSANKTLRGDARKSVDSGSLTTLRPTGGLILAAFAWFIKEQ